MHYEFESANHINEYLEAIKGSEEFFVKRDEENGIQVINYLFNTPTTFPDTRGLTGEELRLAVLRRDCRGIKFDLNGHLITKPYHKFFNLGERADIQPNSIDWSQPHRILEKLDGSMITIHYDKNAYHTHTKMGATDVALPVTKFIFDRPQYAKLYEALKEEGCTCIFEWCSRKQRIVIEYPEDKLILTAIRANYSGKYLSYEKMIEYGHKFGVPIVKALPGSVRNIQQFMDETKELEDAEGYVIRFDTGHMLKVKGLWYCRIHNTKELFLFEKNVWFLILNNELDDAKPFMSDEDKTLVEDFANELEQRILKKSLQMEKFIIEAKEKAKDKKTFALEIVPTLSKFEKSMAFKLWDGNDTKTIVREFLLKNSNNQKGIDDIRDFVDGLNWQDYYW